MNCMRGVTFIKLIASLAIAMACTIGCNGDNMSLMGEEKSGNKYLQDIFNSEGKKGILLHPPQSEQSKWKVYREWPTGEIIILAKRQNHWNEVSFEDSKNSLSKLIIETGDYLYIFTYNVESNVPSGRSIKGVKEGIDLWRVAIGSAEATLVASGLPLGGLENTLVTREKSNEKNIDVCTIDRCLSIANNGTYSWWISGVPDGHEFVELQFKNEDAYALIRKSSDRKSGNADYSRETYSVVMMHPPGSKKLPKNYSVEDNCLPFRLSWTWGKPTWNCAAKVNDLVEIFRHDMKRVPHNGIGDIGLNNSEGRIAWGLSYTLNSLINLNKTQTPILYSASDWAYEIQMLENALELVARQGTIDNYGYSSKRYSTNRKQLLFALHLGRIAQLLSDAESTGITTNEIREALSKIRIKLIQLSDTAEEPMQLGEYHTLRYRKGIDFWADGSNVPFNYVSGYVHGLLASESIPGESINISKQLLKPLTDIEMLENKDFWNYWWGLGRSGWKNSDKVSSNTPNYAGDNAIAHITYRSMDAMAVLRLASISPSSIDPKIIINLRKLVSNGGLLPFVNQELSKLDGGMAELEMSVILRYGRSSQPWELYAQLFALESYSHYLN